MKYKVVWGRKAANDIDAITEHIAADSKASARRVAEYLRGSARLLERSPRLGKATRGETRELILSRFPYVLIYEIHETEVRIIAVMHQAQDRS